MAEHAASVPSPEPAAAPIAEAFAPAAEPAIEVIADVDSLDKDNLGWTKNYVKGLTERLGREQAAAAPDFVMIAYLKREIATYQELLDRVAT